MHVGEVHLFEFLETGDALGHGLEVGQHAAEPALGDIRHVHAGGLGGHCFLSLLLGADEQHGAVMSDGGLDEVIGGVDHIERLEQVDDVNAVALGEDELLHLRVPTTGLVAEVQTCLQHIAHSDLSHGIATSFLSVLAWSCVPACNLALEARPTDTGRREHDANLLQVDDNGWSEALATALLAGWHTKYEDTTGSRLFRTGPCQTLSTGVIPSPLPERKPTDGDCACIASLRGVLPSRDGQDRHGHPDDRSHAATCGP